MTTDISSQTRDTFLGIAQAFTDKGYSQWSTIAGDDGSRWASVYQRLTELLHAVDALSETKEPRPSGMAWWELELLKQPLSPEQRDRFAARHFTGGLPQSAQPIESLYHASKRNKGQYRGPSADYMEFLAASLGLHIPQRYKTCPDHLSVELEVAAYLLDQKDEEAIAGFMTYLSDWLPAYEFRLTQLEDDDARFFQALVSVLIYLCRSLTDQTCSDRRIVPQY